MVNAGQLFLKPKRLLPIAIVHRKDHSSKNGGSLNSRYLPLQLSNTLFVLVKTPNTYNLLFTTTKL